MKRKLLPIVLCLSLLLTLAMGVPGAGLAEQKAAAGAEVSFMLHLADIASEPTFQAIWDAFVAENPDIHMTYIGNNGSAEQMKKVTLAAESASLPDIFWVTNAVAKELAQAGYLLDLSDYLAGSENAGNILPNLTANFVQDGMQYGVPYQAQVKGFWVNNAVFAAHGLTPPAQGTTFDQLLEMVDTLSAAGVTTFLSGAKTPHSCWTFLTAWARYGYYDTVPAILEGAEKFNNPAFVQYFQKLETLAQHGAFSPNITTIDYDQCVEFFSEGKGAILDSGSWLAGSAALAKLGDDISFWWGPVFGDGVGQQQVGMQIPSSPLCVSAKVAEDPGKLAAVYAFLDFYYSQKAADILVERGAVPTIDYHGTAVSDIPAYNAMRATMADAAWVSPSAGPDMIVPSAVQSALYDALYGTMSGIYTPEVALDNIDAVVAQQ